MFCPPPLNLCTETLHPLREHVYICVLRHMTIHQLTYHTKYIMKISVGPIRPKVAGIVG